MKIDLYQSEKKYLRWKEKTKLGIPDISKKTSKVIKQYLGDMEMGLNVEKSNKKGARSYRRLEDIRNRMTILSKHLQKRFDIKDITKVTEEQLHHLFNEIRTGKIEKKNGGKYKSCSDYVKDFNAFWHWWMRVQKKKGCKVLDITEYLDRSGEKPVWVYLTEKQVREMCDGAKYKYKVLIMFLIDSGIRAPTELVNVKVSDFYNNYKELNIREETAKTFGRRIKLMLCSELIRDYVRINELGEDDSIFLICPKVVNKYLKRLAKRVFGDGISLAGEKYSNITMYDFRHVSCCYWLPRYKSESALKYRFGWKKSDKIHYYSELLGMKDTISEEDLLVDVTKTDIEKKLDKSERDNKILNERVSSMETQIAQIWELSKKISMEVG